jgi:hypothetical protein
MRHHMSMYRKYIIKKHKRIQNLFNFLAIAGMLEV